MSRPPDRPDEDASDMNDLNQPIPSVEGIFLSYWGAEGFAIGRDERHKPHTYCILDFDGNVVEAFPVPSGWATAWESFVRLVGDPQPIEAVEQTDAVEQTPSESDSAGHVISDEVKRDLIESLTQFGKYRKAFETGEFALTSFLGTESWSEYAQTVIEVLILDTLMGIEREVRWLNDRLAGDDSSRPLDT